MRSPDQIGISWEENQLLMQQLREKAALEYRRQHNIFEVGDTAVNVRGEETRLLKIWKVDVCPTDKRMSIADYDADGLAGWSRFHCLRHATDAEIKAGKRLEVKSEN